MMNKTIFDIDFPIFNITNNYKSLWTEDNITYIETDSGVYVLDNKNIQGGTLGQRRLRIKNSKLYIPRKVIHTVSQLIKSTYKTFIDNNGEIFTYVKNTRVALNYYKVSRIIKLENIGCVLHFEEIDNPVVLSCRDAYGIGYVGFLHTKAGYITYEYSEGYKENTWRKV